MEAKLGTMKTRMERNGISFLKNLHALVGSSFKYELILSELNSQLQVMTSSRLSLITLVP
jgi:hypothetical protein